VTQSSVRGNNLDTVRQHNLSMVLGIVHRIGSVSRSELTRRTGLNRSTIAALVGELVELELVTEHEPDANNRVGRPSPIVTANPGVVVLAINPEIDAVTVGVVGLDGSVRHRVRHPTESAPTVAEAVAIGRSLVDRLRPEPAAGSRILGIGAAIPGLVRVSDGAVRLAPHLDWHDEPFSELLARATGLPVAAGNDANLGANAERIFGAGRGHLDLVYLNGGASGIGAGVIVDGKPLTGSSGYAGELGHTLVNSAGIRCHCGAIGCLETEVSQSALLRVLELHGADPDQLDRALVAASGNERVAAEVERQLGYLAVAVRNAVNVFNPQLIVLGGFLGSLITVAPGRLEELVTGQALGASAESLVIARAELGSSLLMIGAAELAFAGLLAHPAGVAAGGLQPQMPVGPTPVGPSLSAP
jgi:predicted NBD/HSP70 family sugar kinase